MFELRVYSPGEGKRDPAVDDETQGRFFAKVEQMRSGCWQWVGAVQGKYYKRDNGGYGSFRFRGVVTPAHRVSWEIFNGPVPDGLHLDHLCRNTRCVNPDHLEPVTAMENFRRGVGNKGENMSQRTHCPKGHEYTPENTTFMTKGNGGNPYRACLACRREIYRKYDAKRRRNGGLRDAA